MDDPAPNLDLAAGGEAHHLAAPPLPPPPPPVPPSAQLALPPHVPSFWPFTDPTVCFFMDPSSPEVQEKKRIFEITSQAFGQTFPSTTDTRLASHLVLDPSNDANEFLRRLAPDKVVSLRWLEDGFLKPHSPPEDQSRLGRFEEKKEKVEGTGDIGGRRVEKEQGKVALTSTSTPRPLSHYVNPKYASRNGWLKSEEEDIARFLASDPQPDEDGRSIWDQYHFAHPSRTAQSYQKHYKDRKDVYFDSKIAELGGAFNAQPAVHKHAEDDDVEFEPLVKPRTATKVSSRDRSPSFEDSEEDRSDVSSSDEDFEGPSFRTHRRSNSKSSSVVNSSSSTRAWNPEDRKDLVIFLAKYTGSVFSVVTSEYLKKHPRYTLGSMETHYYGLRKAYDQAAKSYKDEGKSLDSVVPVSRIGTSNPKWTKQEERDLVEMLAHRKGSKRAVYETFSDKHPRRPSSSVAAHCQDHKKRIEADIAALQRKVGKESTRTRAPMRESEELEKDDSMGDDEDSDDEEMDLRTPTSAPSSSNFLVGRKRPQES